MARLQLSLLGSFEARLDCQPLHAFESDKGRALLAYLAVESDRAHRREALAHLLWADYAPSAARANLRNALSDLHTVLRDRGQPTPFLCATPETIGLNGASDLQVDVLDFEALLAKPPTLDRLEEAVSLYRDEFLAGFAPRDSEPFEEWLLLVRERLRREYAAALRQLAGIHEDRGESAHALEDARRWVDADPWDETAHRSLMRLLARSGQRSAALVEYERCKEALEADLGIGPEEATEQLYRQIRDGELYPVDAIARPRHLPSPLLPLIGREEELESVLGYLRDPSTRLLAILGPGGTGKTRLAVEAGWRAMDLFADGVCFISCSPLAAPELLIPAIGDALGLDLLRGAPGSSRPLLDFLSQRRLLLILDSFEHLLPAAADVAHLLEAAPDVEILATSRSRLGVQGEQLFPLGGLSLGAEPDFQRGEACIASPAGGVSGAAGELFLLGARRVRPDYAPAPEEWPQLRRICHLVDGVPLALLLASSWMQLLSPAEIASHVSQDAGHGLAFLAAEWPDLPERQRSMRAVLDHSWNLLPERERAVFASLSVLQGRFGAESAEHVAGATLRDLLHLLDRSLLHRAPGGRYELHDLVRQYAHVRLQESPSAKQDVRDRHAAYYVTLLSRWRAALWSPQEEAALRQFEEETPNVAAAWEWAAQRCQSAWLIEGADGLGDYMMHQSRLGEGEHLFGSGAAALHGGPPTAESWHAEAKLLGWQAGFALALGRVSQARTRLREALALLGKPGRAGQEIARERAWLCHRLGKALAGLGSETERQLAPVEANESEPMPLERARLIQATRLYQRSLALSRQAGDRPLIATTLTDLAAVMAQRRRHKEAWAYQQEALAELRELGAPTPLFEQALAAATLYAEEQGRYADSRRLVQEAHQMLQEMGDAAATMPTALSAMADGFYYTGQLEEAHPFYERSVAACQTLGLQRELARTLVLLGRNHLHLGRPTEARLHLSHALALSQDLGYEENVIAAEVRLCFLAVFQGNADEAEGWLERCRRGYADRGVAQNLYMVWMLEEDIAALRRDWGRLRDAVFWLLRQYADRGAFAVAPHLCGLACGLAERGEIERAVELYALAKTSPWVSNSAYYQQVHERRVYELAGQLPPNVMSVAEKRGRARDWRRTTEGLLAELSEEQEQAAATPRLD